MKALTIKRKQICILIGKGYTDRYIAQLLNLSPRTISTHTKKLYKDYEADSRAHLITILFCHGLLTSKDFPKRPI